MSRIPINPSILFCCFILLSCKEQLKKVEEHYPTGELKLTYFVDKDGLKQGEEVEFYENGRTYLKTRYYNDIINDTVYFYRNDRENSLKLKQFSISENKLFFKKYRENGNVAQEGIFDSLDRKVGKWRNYKENGDLYFIKEYRIIKGKEWPNQVWEFLSTGDTLNTGTSMRYQVSDTVVKLGDSLKFTFTPEVMQHPRGGSDFMVVIPKDFQNKNFTYDFSNMPEDPREHPSFQIIKSLKHVEGFENEKKAMDSTELYKTVMFYLKPNQLGKDTLRGYFDEVKRLTPREAKLQKLDSNKVIDKGGFYYVEHRDIYFDVPIEVIE